jgi:hypothetical protein
MRTALLVWLLVPSLATTVVAQQNAAATPPKPQALSETDGLVLVEPVTLVIEHPSNKGTGRVLIRNNGTAAVPLEISIGDWASGLESNRKSPIGAKATLAWVDVTGKPLATPPSTLAPRKTAYATLELTDIWESGVSVARIYNEGRAFGEVNALKYKLPLAVKLDVATPDKPEIAFQRNQKTQIILKNDDPLTYQVTTQLIVGSETMPATAMRILTPNGPLRIEIKPPNAWFRLSLSQFFKPDAQPARLLLSVSPQVGGVQWPVKSLPFQANLSYYSQNFRDAASIVILFVILLLGGVMSVVLNNAIPNAFAQIDLKRRLVAAGRNQRSLAALTDRIRGALATEEARLRELLASRAAFSPDFQTIAAEAKLQLTLLETRIELLAQLDALAQWLRTESKEQPLPAPTRVAAAEDILRDLAARVAFTTPSDQDLKDLKQSALVTANTKKIEELTARIEKIREKDNEFETALGQRQARAIDRRRTLSNNGRLKGLELRLADLFRAFEAIGAISPFPNAHTGVDTTLTKVEWVLDYVEATATTAFSGDRLQAIEDEFVKRLGPQTWAEMKRAQEYLLQFGQGAMPLDIAEAIRSGVDLGIEGPMSVQPELPSTFCVRFFGTQDFSSARDEVKCFWDFGDGLHAQGWEVNHFYKRAPMRLPLSRYLLGEVKTITVTFQGADGQPIIPEGQKDRRKIERRVKVHPGVVVLGARTRLEVVWLLASLAIPFLGLLAGARQDFMKTDAASGVIVVFLLGFGANHVKDLFKKAA